MNNQDEQGSNGEKHILVIDDEREICKLTIEMLKKQNYKAVGENFFSTALEYFKKNFNNISLVLMDYTMPGESPIDAIKKFRKISHSIPIIIMSGYVLDDIDLLNGSQNLEINAVIQKPFDMFYLAEKVQGVL